MSIIAAEQHVEEILDLLADPDQHDLGRSDISDVDDSDGHDDDHSSTLTMLIACTLVGKALIAQR